MTAGAPTSRPRDAAARADAQADRIRGMLARGTDMPTIAANVGCTLRRVQDVAAQNPPAIGTNAPPTAKQAAAGIPAPRKPAQVDSGRRRGKPAGVPNLVAPAEPARATRDRLIRHIAADPILTTWLHGHNAKILEDAAATLLIEHGEGAAATLLRIAAAHRRGDAPAFPAGPDTPRPIDQRCGEQRGYQAHLRRGETPCDACRAANTAYHQQHRRHTDQTTAQEAS